MASITSLSPSNESSLNQKSINYNIEKKIDSLTSDALPYYNSILKNVCSFNGFNAKIVCDFIADEINNQNIKTTTKLTHIKIICWFSKQLNYKDFQQVTRDDVTNYLTSLKKTYIS